MVDQSQSKQTKLPRPSFFKTEDKVSHPRTQEKQEKIDEHPTDDLWTHLPPFP